MCLQPMNSSNLPQGTVILGKKWGNDAAIFFTFDFPWIEFSSVHAAHSSPGYDGVRLWLDHLQVHPCLCFVTPCSM